MNSDMTANRNVWEQSTYCADPPYGQGQVDDDNEL